MPFGDGTGPRGLGPGAGRMGMNLMGGAMFGQGGKGRNGNGRGLCCRATDNPAKSDSAIRAWQGNRSRKNAQDDVVKTEE